MNAKKHVRRGIIISEKPFRYPKDVSQSCFGFSEGTFSDIKTCHAICLYVRNTKYFGFLKSVFRISSQFA